MASVEVHLTSKVSKKEKKQLSSYKMGQSSLWARMLATPNRSDTSAQRHEVLGCFRLEDVGMLWVPEETGVWNGDYELC